MRFAGLALIGLSLSADAFAVSACKGLAMKKKRANLKSMALVGLWFGGFQALMPLLGFYLGSYFQRIVESFDHWIAFGLLTLIGINMIREALRKDEEEEDECTCLCPKNMFVMALATSIDAFAVGISLAMTGGTDIWAAVALIGSITFLLSALGVKIGNVFGSKLKSKAEFAGGCILIVLGLSILYEHLF